MPSTEDLVLDRIIASLQEARIWKDKPRELRAEIGSLKAERDRAKAEVDRARAELRDLVSTGRGTSKRRKSDER
jgi:hypothetical protein